MKLFKSTVVAAMLCLSGTANAGLITFTQTFTSGFPVSINNGSQLQSGPFTITAYADENAKGTSGAFELQSLYFSGAGFNKQLITTPMELLIWGMDRFAFQLKGQFNTGITGWNGSSSGGFFITDMNDLSTITQLPFTTIGTSTFWYDGLGSKALTLASGDTIGASIGNSGPDGVFTITREAADVSAPSGLALFALSVFGLLRARKKSKIA